MRIPSIIIILSIACSSLSHGQTSGAPIKGVRFGADTLREIPPAQHPPKLLIDEVRFVGTENQSMIAASEKGYIRFRIENTGEGPAYNLRLYANEAGAIAGLSYDRHRFLAKTFAPGESRVDSIFVEGRPDLRDGRARFELILREGNGYGSETAALSVPTREYSLQKVEVLNGEVSDLSGIEMRLKMSLKNQSSSGFRNIRVRISAPRTVYAKGDSIKTLRSLNPDESAEVYFTFVKNQHFNEALKDVFAVTLEDESGKPLLAEKAYIERKPVAEIIPASGNAGNASQSGRKMLTVVDREIPRSTGEVKNSHIYALVIGNEEYTDNPPVPFANQDALTFANYCALTFNIPAANIEVIQNASLNRMRTGLKSLARKARQDASGDAELIIYYSGHGVMAKDKESKSSDEYDQYFIPVDASGATADMSMSRKEIYAELNNVSYKRASLFLDACNIFTGDRPLMKEAKYEWKGNMVVFSSSSPNETSGTYMEKGHGMFTYFLLESIWEKKGKLDYEYMFDKVSKSVIDQSLNTAKPQKPVVESSPQVGEGWKKWKMPE